MKLKILMLTLLAFVLVANRLSTETKAEETEEVPSDHYFENFINKLQHKLIAKYVESKTGKQVLVRYFVGNILRNFNAVKTIERKQKTQYMHWRHGRAQ